MTARRHPIASVLAGVLILLAMSPAMSPVVAQTPLPQTSMDIQTRIQRSVELQRQALQSLTDVERAERLTSRAYTELQGALSTMIIKASNAKFRDPLFEIQKRRGEQALALLQVARDSLQDNRPGARPARGQAEGGQPSRSSGDLENVRSNLEQALRLTSTLVF